jgi:uncharacterized protein YhaN
LKAARESATRIDELNQALDSSRKECETLRAELERRNLEDIDISRLAANLVEDRAAIEQSEVARKELDCLSSDRRETSEEPRSAVDPRLEVLTVQLDETRAANERLRSLLKVFGMVRHLGQ